MQKAVSQIIGKVGVVEEPAYYKGKWVFSVWVLPIDYVLEDDQEPDTGPIGPYDTKGEALDRMFQAVKICGEVIERDFGGTVTVKYINPENEGLIN